MQDGIIMARLAGEYKMDGRRIKLVSHDSEFDDMDEMQQVYAPERVAEAFGSD